MEQYSVIVILCNESSDSVVLETYALGLHSAFRVPPPEFIAPKSQVVFGSDCFPTVHSGACMVKYVSEKSPNVSLTLEWSNPPSSPLFSKSSKELSLPLHLHKYKAISEVASSSKKEVELTWKVETFWVGKKVAKFTVVFTNHGNMSRDPKTVPIAPHEIDAVIEKYDNNIRAAISKLVPHVKIENLSTNAQEWLEENKFRPNVVAFVSPRLEKRKRSISGTFRNYIGSNNTPSLEIVTLEEEERKIESLLLDRLFFKAKLDALNEKISVFTLTAPVNKVKMLIIADYIAQGTNELTLKRGQIVAVLDSTHPVWWYGELLYSTKNSMGYFPSHIVWGGDVVLSDKIPDVQIKVEEQEAVTKEEDEPEENQSVGETSQASEVYHIPFEDSESSRENGNDELFELLCDLEKKSIDVDGDIVGNVKVEEVNVTEEFSTKAVKISVEKMKPLSSQAKSARYPSPRNKSPGTRPKSVRGTTSTTGRRSRRRVKDEVSALKTSNKGKGSKDEQGVGSSNVESPRSVRFKASRDELSVPAKSRIKKASSKSGEFRRNSARSTPVPIGKPTRSKRKSRRRNREDENEISKKGENVVDFAKLSSSTNKSKSKGMSKDDEDTKASDQPNRQVLELTSMVEALQELVCSMTSELEDERTTTDELTAELSQSYNKIAKLEKKVKKQEEELLRLKKEN